MGQPFSQPAGLEKIHVIFKTHLDVGFTDLAANVGANYFEHYIPGAIELARRLRQAGEQDRFVWTTGSWLIYEYLEQASSENRRRLEASINAGDIAWHGLPFTTHSELMDAGLFRFGLSLSQELDQRFGKHTLAAKMTDVPGHTLGIIPLMAQAGIQFFHIGVNPASTPPDVPPVFVWRSPQGADVMVMYHKGSYGDLMTIPGLHDAICFAHTGDNLGPQSPEQIQTIFRDLRMKFPGVAIVGSTLDAFAEKLLEIKERLPVVTQEMGDTWIHGAATDPQKAGQFRELLRLRSAWLAAGKVDPQNHRFKAFSRCLLMVPEHTCGLDVKTHLNDYQAYDAAAFKAARVQPNFRKMEQSWEEQRAYLRHAVQALEPGLAEEARSALKAAAPLREDFDSYEVVTDPSAIFTTTFFTLGIHPQNGAIFHLKDRQTKRTWATASHPLGLLRYVTYDRADYERFYRQYIVHQKEVASWAIPDFTKPGIETAGSRHEEWEPELRRVYRRTDAQADEWVVRLAPAEKASREFGCPQTFILRMRLPKTQPSIEFDLQWFDKQACRLPEAIWFSFAPLTRDRLGWKLRKLGQEISPLDVIRNGNRKLHAVMPGIVYRDAQAGLEIDSLDAPLVAPGQRSLLNFNNRQPPLNRGMHFLLYNNIWGTNFPMWYEDDARFRFNLKFG